MNNNTEEALETKAIGPLAVEPEEWTQGARLAICHRDRGVIAVIEPINRQDEPTMETAQREPFDEAYAHLFAASPELLEEVKRFFDLYQAGESKTDSGDPVVHVAVSPSWAEKLRHLIAVAEGVEEPAEWK